MESTPEGDNTSSPTYSLKFILLVGLLIAIVLYALYKWIQCRNDDTDPVTKKLRNFLGRSSAEDNGACSSNDNERYMLNSNAKNNYDTFTNCSSSGNNNTFRNDIEMNKDNSTMHCKVNRFAIDYCRTSPNITHKEKDIISLGWRSASKYFFSVNYELLNHLNEKVTYDSIMTVIPLYHSHLNFEDDNIRISLPKLMMELSDGNEGIVDYTHFAILNTQNVMIKIDPYYINGSLRDMINKTEPLVYFNKKIMKRGNGLSKSLVLSFSQQILKGMAYLHKNNWYHLHLHSGNVMIDRKGEKCFINDIDNSIFDFPIYNEKYYHYVYDYFNNSSSSFMKEGMISEIVSSINIYEKIDIISFGRLLYEMTTGRELNTYSPDDLELKDFDPIIKTLLSLIFPKKYSNESQKLCLPDVNAIDLLKILQQSNDLTQSYNNENGYNSTEYSSFIQFDKYASIKERIFKQSSFIKRKLKDINDNEINTDLI